jgi:hypothetical protein
LATILSQSKKRKYQAKGHQAILHKVILNKNSYWQTESSIPVVKNREERRQTDCQCKRGLFDMKGFLICLVLPTNSRTPIFIYILPLSFTF